MLIFVVICVVFTRAALAMHQY